MTKLRLLALILILALPGCSLFDLGEDDCEGHVELIKQNVETTFPDTLTLVLREEPYLFEIDDPPLFRHTTGKKVSLGADTQEDEVVLAFAGYSPTARLDITTRSTGRAEVFVSGFSRCRGAGPTFSFIVRVVDMTSSALTNIVTPKPARDEE